LAVDESMLTGESIPIRPQSGTALSAGTFVVQGEAEATVVSVGSATRLAGIQALTDSVDRPESPLTVELHIDPGEDLLFDHVAFTAWGMCSGQEKRC
jgi:magnesium-transporting ATPase (P-type)